MCCQSIAEQILTVFLRHLRHGTPSECARTTSSKHAPDGRGAIAHEHRVTTRRRALAQASLERFQSCRARERITGTHQRHRAIGFHENQEITGVIIPDHWLRLFASAFEIPQVIDHVTGESLLFVTDHYRVQDWEALDQALSSEVDIEGSREEGWSRIFEGGDGLMRTSLSIDAGKRPDRIKVSYRTQKYADEGRPWFEAVAGAAVIFVSREISDPKGMLANWQPNEARETPVPALPPPEMLTELIETRIRQLYVDWADKPLPILDDKTPRKAIQTPEGLKQVKFLLHTYEHGEAQQAQVQHRAPVSYDFLWQSLGITP